MNDNYLPEGVYETKDGDKFELVTEKAPFSGYDDELYYLMINEDGQSEVISDSIIVFENSYVSNPSVPSTDTAGGYMKPLAGTDKPNKGVKKKKKKKYHKKVSIMKRKK